MWKSIVNLFTPPSFAEDENKARVARYLHWIALSFMAAILAIIVFGKFGAASITFNIFDATLFVFFLVIASIWGMSKRGHVRAASVLLVVMLWLAVNSTALFGSGVRDSSFIANFVVLMAAGLLIGGRAAVSLAVMTIAAGFGLANAEVAGITPSVYTPTSPVIVIFEMSFIFAIFAGLIWLLISGLESAIQRTRTGAKELEEANRDLNSARLRLEENRNELLAANEQLHQRAEKINTIANISKTITLVQEIERLLPSVVTTISDRFGYSQVGIYLLDETRQNALLRASSSEGGLRMMRRKQRVNVGSNDIIGVVTERGDARVAQIGETQNAQDDHDDPPDTRSRLALPLKVKEIVIGALDIHSAKPNAFSAEDVSTMQILADQVAIAIQNARSSEQAKDALHRAEIVSRQLTSKAWQEYSEAQSRRGYRYDGIKPEPIRETVRFADAERPVTIPINLRGQVIGNLKMNPTEAGRRWTDDEIAMAQATAERVALALESARLLDEAQKRAQRETFLSEVSTKLGASFQVDSILRDTVEELGQTLRGAKVSFQLVNPAAGALLEDKEDGA
jgi:GAF domain-containing protein